MEGRVHYTEWIAFTSSTVEARERAYDMAADALA